MNVKQMIAPLTLAAYLIATTPAYAVEVLDDNVTERPAMGAMLLDAVIARPLGTVVTVVGAGLFVATLPFSMLGGNVKESASALVGTPAKATFKRCLGCTPFQDETNPDTFKPDSQNDTNLPTQP